MQELFSIEMTGMALSSGVTTPFCDIIAPKQFDVTMYTHPPVGPIDVLQLPDGRYFAHIMFWKKSRAFIEVGDMHARLVDLGNSSIGCVVSSKVVEFQLQVKQRATPVHVAFPDHDADGWHAFGSISLDQKLEVLKH